MLSTLDRAQIAARIPHAGRMCLLERVERWDGEAIVCHATSHRDPANPLRERGRLGAACGVEYAGQAMALHGSLTAAVGARPRAGFLVALRELELHCERLDDLAGDLLVEATRVLGDDARVVYAFTVSGDGRRLLEGRATVILDADTTGGTP